MTINQRLGEYIALKKISNVKLSEVARCSPQVVGTWFTHNVKVKGDYILNIINEYKDINARWLITGEGEMLDELKQIPSEIELTEFGTVLMERLLEEKEMVGSLKKEVEYLKAENDRLRTEGTGRGQKLPNARAG